MAPRMVECDSFSVYIGDVGDEGYPPQLVAWAAPSTEDGLFGGDNLGGGRLVVIYFLVIVDNCVSGVDKFAGAEKGICCQCRDDVCASCRFPHIVMQFADHGCWCGIAVGEVKNDLRFQSCWYCRGRG